MIEVFPKGLGHIVDRALLHVDHFFAGHWWRVWLQRRTLKRFEETFERTGDRSFETRRATEAVREADFAVDFWRRAPAQVRKLVDAAERAGVPPADLRLMVFNRDLVTTKAGVKLRRSIVLQCITGVTDVLFWFHWFLMMVLCFAANAPWPKRLAVAVVVTLVYWVLYRVWSLFLGRPCRAVNRHAKTIELVIHGERERTQGSVQSIDREAR